MSSSPPRFRVILSTAGLLVLGACKSDVVGPDKQVAIIEVTPKTARIYVVGDSTKFTAALTTEAGTAGSGIEVGWVARDKSLLSVSPTGVAKSLKKGGSTYVVASAGGKSDSALVEVPATPCGSVAPATLTVGQVALNVGANGYCAASAPDAEYTVIALNNSLTSSATVSIEVIGQALAAPPTSSGASLASRAGFAPGTGLVAPARHRDDQAELAFRAAERATLSPLVPTAREWYRTRSGRAQRSAAVPAVGDQISVNVNMGTTCASKTIRNARVAAVSATAIMLDDLNNPSGGFTDGEFASLAAAFDTLIQPVNVQNFGAPTDLDGNGRVFVLMTRAINELTTASSTSFTAGRTMSRDLFPKTTTGDKPGCDASNVGELFYMLTPDPTAAVNGNPFFTKAFVQRQSIGTIAHEYQHMINFGRRIYLIPGLSSASWFDEIWVHEGLSHMAEELIFYKASGTAPRSNIGLTAIRATQATLDAFNAFMVSNFGLYDSYADSAGARGPYRTIDDIGTRGATWSFFRYAADQIASSDGDIWFRFVNSGLVGMSNVQGQFGLASSAAFQDMLRDFVISVYADDYVTGIPAKYRQPSWDMRNIYPGFQDPTFFFPLASNKLVDNTAKASTLVAGGFAVYRFKGLAGTESLVRATGPSGGALPATVNLSVIRTR